MLGSLKSIERSYVTIATVRNTVTEFIKMQKTAVGRACRWNGATSFFKGSPATNNSQQEKSMIHPRKRWEDGVREDAVVLFGTRVWKTIAKDKGSWRQTGGTRWLSV
jgi:hypothetical protein